MNYRELQYDKENFLTICKILFTNTSIPLRQQEKIFAHSRLALKGFKINNYVFPHVFLFLNYIKIVHNDLYEAVKNRSLTIVQFQDEYNNVVRTNKTEDIERALIWLEVYLVIFYQNHIDPRHQKTKLYEHDKDSGKNKLLISSKINSKKDMEFLGILESINSREGGDLSIEYFIKKTELLDNLEF